MTIKKVFNVVSIAFVLWSVLTMLIVLLDFVPFLEPRLLRVAIAGIVGYFIVTTVTE